MPILNLNSISDYCNPMIYHLEKFHLERILYKKAIERDEQHLTLKDIRESIQDESKIYLGNYRYITGELLYRSIEQKFFKRFFNTVKYRYYHENVYTYSDLYIAYTEYIRYYSLLTPFDAHIVEDIPIFTLKYNVEHHGKDASDKQPSINTVLRFKESDISGKGVIKVDTIKSRTSKHSNRGN